MRPSIRFEVFKRDRFTCVYCGRKGPEIVLEVDHVVPIASGGSDELDNLVTSCADCNRGKAARPLGQLAPVLDPAARAEQIAEHERQIAEYGRWRVAQREREDQDLRMVADAFGAIPGATFRRGDEDRWFWDQAGARRLLRLLGVHRWRRRSPLDPRGAAPSRP